MKLIADSMFEEYKEPLYAPPPLLSRMVEAGQLARSPAGVSHLLSPGARAYWPERSTVG